MKRAVNEVADAGLLGGSIHDTLVECKKAILAQSNTVDRAFAKRIRYVVRDKTLAARYEPCGAARALSGKPRAAGF